MNKAPTTLIIMDGFGIAPPADDNAVTLAKTPVLDRLFQEYAHTTLSASGLDVGLPAGQMGNSEVGHTNIGGGRVVVQDLPRIIFVQTPRKSRIQKPCTDHACDQRYDSQIQISIRILMISSGFQHHKKDSEDHSDRDQNTIDRNLKSKNLK